MLVFVDEINWLYICLYIWLKYIYNPLSNSNHTLKPLPALCNILLTETIACSLIITPQQSFVFRMLLFTVKFIIFFCSYINLPTCAKDLLCAPLTARQPTTPTDEHTPTMPFPIKYSRIHHKTSVWSGGILFGAKAVDDEVEESSYISPNNEKFE